MQLVKGCSDVRLILLDVLLSVEQRSLGQIDQLQLTSKRGLHMGIIVQVIKVHQVCGDYTVLESLVYDHFNSIQTPEAVFIVPNLVVFVGGPSHLPRLAKTTTNNPQKVHNHWI